MRRMHRRQVTNDTDTGNGIFVLVSSSADSTGKSKRGRRKRNLCSYSFTLFGILAVVLVILVFKQLPSTLLTELNSNSIDESAADTDRHDDNISTSRDQPNSAAGNVPMQTSDPPPIMIPHRLLFTYKYNLIAPEIHDPAFDEEDPLTANVQHTINQYKAYWDAADGGAIDPQKNRTHEVKVTFLSDSICTGIIARTEPRLVKPFYRERKGEYKADVCRAAALYEYGGHYFDIDIGVVEPVNFDALNISSRIPGPLSQLRAIKGKNWAATSSFPSKDDVVTFSTVYNRQGRFYQAYTAATPRHPVLKRSLEYMVAYYEGTLEKILPQWIIDSTIKMNRIIASRKKTGGMGVGPYTLSIAHRATTDEEWEEYVTNMMKEHGYVSANERVSKEIPAKRRYARFLYEISLEDEELKGRGLFGDVPLQDANYKKKIHWCNYVCFGGPQVYFYSRVPGSKGCPLEKR